MRSIRQFGVEPANPPGRNRAALQEAIDWASGCGAALFVEPADEPYRVDGGLQLRRNASLVGVHGPTGRGTRHPGHARPVGSVLQIEDEDAPFVTVEAATQLRGLQLWYPGQTLTDPARIVAYPATVRVSSASSAQGVTLSNLTFYGEYLAMDFQASPQQICEQILCEHCYGYPLSGEFIGIDYCYDIPRLLHCHVNPANQRFIRGGFSREVIDHVVRQPRFTYTIDHTDNAQVMDVFTFGAYGGIRLGPATYGQLTNFNFDCVTIGVHKLGDNTFNRNWQLAQGSIIANAGPRVEDVHPVIVEGEGHTALSNVEAFSGQNGALTALGQSQDFLLVRGQGRPTVTLSGCRMRNYVAPAPLTLQNPRAIVQAVACVDRDERLYNRTIPPDAP